MFIYDNTKEIYRLLKHYFKYDYKIYSFVDYSIAIHEASKLSRNSVAFVVVNHPNDLAVVLMLMSRVDLIFVSTNNKNLDFVLKQNESIKYLDTTILKSELINKIKKIILHNYYEDRVEHKNVS